MISRHVPITWGWVAGFFDGDGWVTYAYNRNCSTKRYAAGFTQRATGKWMMTRLSRFLVSKGIRTKVIERDVKVPQLPVKVQMLDVRIREQRSLEIFFESVLPFLILKRRYAIDCLKYVSDRLEKRGLNVVPIEAQVTNIYWTKNDVSMLLKLHKQGYANRVIAAKLNRSVNSVTQRLRRMGLTRIDRMTKAYILAVNDVENRVYQRAPVRKAMLKWHSAPLKPARRTK
jgi:hypothetical protein